MIDNNTACKYYNITCMHSVYNLYIHTFSNTMSYVMLRGVTSDRLNVPTRGDVKKLPLWKGTHRYVDRNWSLLVGDHTV